MIKKLFVLLVLVIIVALVAMKFTKPDREAHFNAVAQLTQNMNFVMDSPVEDFLRLLSNAFPYKYPVWSRLK